MLLRSLQFGRHRKYFLALYIGLAFLFISFFVHAGKAFADCGVPDTGSESAWQGVVVVMDWQHADGSGTTQSNNTQVQITSTGQNDGRTTYPNNNIVELNSSEQEVNSIMSDTNVNGNAGATFSQVGTGWAGCSSGQDYGHSSAVVLGYGNTSPVVSNYSNGGFNGTYNWALRCGSLENNEQTFYFTGVGVPAGARSVGANGQTGYWTTASVGADNGDTTTEVLTYIEPPPPIPPPTASSPSTVSCTQIIYGQPADVVVGSGASARSYAVSAILTLNGANVYSSGLLQDDVNQDKPVTRSDSATIEPTAQAISFYALYYYSKNGTLEPDGTSPILLGTAGPCYSASCSISVDSGLPDNDVIPGRPFTVYATISNTSVPYTYVNSSGGLTTTGSSLYIPGDLGGALQFQNADGGYSSFAPTGYPGGIASNGVETLSFSATVNGAGTMGAGLAYANNFFLGSCTTPITLYQSPVISGGVACQSNIGGVAYDPYIPGYPIAVDIYADGPAGTGAFIGEVQSSGAGNSYSLAMPAAYQDGQNHTFYAYGIDPFGYENSAPATIAMTGCEAFHIAPTTNGAVLLRQNPTPPGGYVDTDENPDYFGSTTSDTQITVTYNGNSFYGPSSSFSPGFPGVPVNGGQPTYTYTKNGAVVSSGVIPSPNGNGRFVDQSWAAPLLPVSVTTTSAGDDYCLEDGVIPTDGFIQNDGTLLSETGGPDTQQSCDTVKNRPFFKVYGSGVFAGGSFSTINSSCTGGGELASWNDDSGTYPTSGDYGASSQFSAVALGNIVGFASAQTPNFGRSPSDLSFANTSGIGSADPYSPELGGNYGAGSVHATQCFTSLGQPPNATSLGASPIIDVGSLAPGSYTATGNVTLNGGQIGDGNNVSLFVTGNVYVTSDITYKNTGWTLNSNQTTDTPSFGLVVNDGSISISPNVVELDGIYTAQPTSQTSADGEIYTCDQGFGAPSAGLIANAYSACKNQLTVYGNFVADKVVMMRTFGSLRDEAPTPGTPGSPGSTAPSEPPAKRPTPQYNYSCLLSGNGYYTEGTGGTAVDGSGTANCVAGGTSEGYDQTAPGTQYDVPCVTTSGTAAFIYVRPGDSCPTGTSAVSVPPSEPPAPRPTPQYNYGCSGGPGGYYYTEGSGGTSTNGSGTADCFAGGTSQGYGETLPGTEYNIPCESTSNPAEYLYIINPADGTQSCPAGTSTPGMTPPTPGTNATPATGTNCSNSIGAYQNHSLLPTTCAAEVFDFSPELYLSTPAVKPTNGGSFQPTAISSLPPVL
jgi:hypothetical protein